MAINKVPISMQELSSAMQETAGLRDQISQQVRGQYQPQMDDQKKQYLDKLSKIASMDQRLGKVYGDPNSKLYIEHAGQRESAIAGSRTTGYQEADEVGQGIGQTEKNIEVETEKALKAYSQLLTKANKKGGTGKGKKKATINLANQGYLQLAEIGDDDTAKTFLSLPTSFLFALVSN